MKKLTATLLALCLLLAAVPALGEDLSGTWYSVMAGVTIAAFQLNSNGSVEVAAAGTEKSPDDSWTQDGDTVTITVGGSAETFTYDGTVLNGASYPFPLSREPSTLSIETVSAMKNGGEYELPEGVTELEAAAVYMDFMAEYVKLYGPTETAADTAEVTVVKENFKIIKSYSGYSGVYTAKLRNDTDKPFFITGGTMQLTDKDGNLAGEAKYLYPSGSKYLEPGEITFVGMKADLADKIEVDVAANIQVKTDSYQKTDYAVAVENPAYVKGAGEYDSDTLRVTVVNNSDEFLAGIEAVLVLEDAEGNLLDMETESLYRYELGPHSSLTLVSAVDSKVRDYLVENGIEPASVEAFAWVENE